MIGLQVSARQKCLKLWEILMPLIQKIKQTLPWGQLANMLIFDIKTYVGRLWKPFKSRVGQCSLSFLCWTEKRKKGNFINTFECSRMPTAVLQTSSVKNLQTSSVQNFQNKSFPIQFPVISNFSNFTINYNIVPN